MECSKDAGKFYGPFPGLGKCSSKCLNKYCDGTDCEEIVTCDPTVKPLQMCPGNKECPKCGKKTCLCPRHVSTTVRR